MLVIDIGNTFTRIVAFAGDAIVGRRSVPTKTIQVSEVEQILRELAQYSSDTSLWIASVAPNANAVVDSAADKAGLRRRFIRSGFDPIIPHRLKTPQTTGVDRLLAALAAGERHFSDGAGRNGYVVVQCGSAATVDIVDPDGYFCGGYILPGPTLWLNGIAGAAQLPNLAHQLPDWNAVTIGDNTQDAILNGMAVSLPVAVASTAMIINSSLEKRSGGADGPLPVAVTGGWGEAVTRVMQFPHVFDRDLLLHGIRFFAQKAGQAG